MALMLQLGQIGMVRRLGISDDELAALFEAMVRPLFDQWAYRHFFDFDSDYFPLIDIPATPENFANPLINRRWSGWHRMALSPYTPLDYVLGTLPVAPGELIGAGDWGISGPLAANLDIQSKSSQAPGLIALTGTSGLAPGNYLHTVTTPKGGTYQIGIPVLDTDNMGTWYADSFRFLDSANGSDSNAGGGPAFAFQSIGGADHISNFMYLKNGSTFTVTDDDNLRHNPAFGNGKRILSYGDPSMPRPIIRPDVENFTRTALLHPTDNTDYTNLIVDGIDYDAAGLGISFLYDTSFGTDVAVRNCRFRNNSDLQAGANYFRNGARLLFEHNEMDDYNGDGVYYLNFKDFLCQFNIIGAARGSGNADPGQCTDEFTSLERCERGVIRFNALIVDRDVNATKGGWACEGAENVDNYGNLVTGGKFFITTGAWQNGTHDNLGYNHPTYEPVFAGGGDNGFGYGPQQPGGRQREWGNISINTFYAFYKSGFKADDWMARERFDRPDIENRYNIAVKASRYARLTETITGHYHENVMVDVTAAFASDLQGEATLTETVASWSISGDEITLTPPNNAEGKNGHNMFGANLKITVAGFDQSAANGTFVPSEVYYNFGNAHIKYRLPADVTPPASLTASGTVTVGGNQKYLTTTLEDPVAVASVADLPKLQEANYPTLSVSGVLQEGVEVTLDYTLEPGQSARIRWAFNGEECPEHFKDKARIIVPVGFQSEYGYRFENSFVPGNELNMLQCYLFVVDGAGNENIYAATWDDALAQRFIQVDTHESVASRTGLQLLIDPAKTDAIRTDTGAGGDEYGVLDLSFNGFVMNEEGGQPASGSATMNGLNALLFDGVDDCLMMDYQGVLFSSHFSMFITFENVAMADNACLFSMGRSSVDRVALIYDSTAGVLNLINRIDGANDSLVSTIDVSSGIHTAFFKVQQNAWALSVDGEDLITGTSGDFVKRVALLNSQSKVRIGADVDGSNAATAHANVKIGDVRLYTGFDHVLDTRKKIDAVGPALSAKFNSSWDVFIAPQDLEGLALWLDATNAGALTDDGAGLISQWNDLSGNDHHATAAGTARPTSGVDTINSLNGLQFNGSSNVMALPSALHGINNNGVGNSVIVIAKVNGATATGGLITGLQTAPSGAETWGIVPQFGSDRVAYYSLSSYLRDVTPDTDAHIFAMIADAVTPSREAIFDGSLGTSAFASQEAMEVLHIGRSRFDYLPCTICEILIYDRPLSNDEFNQLMKTYIVPKYNLSWTDLA